MRWSTFSVLLLATALIPSPALSAPLQPTSASAPAPGTPTSLLERIYTRADEIEKLRAALDHPDLSVRLAAFDVMVNSSNPALRELAITTGHTSDDEAIRALAIRAAFAGVQVMEVTLAAPEGASEQEQEKLQSERRKNGGRVSAVEYDPASGKFTGYFSSGQVSGTVLTFTTTSCTGTLTNAKGTWDFQGTVRCGGSVFEGHYSLR